MIFMIQVRNNLDFIIVFTYILYFSAKKASIVYELPELGPCKSQQETSTQMPSSSDGQRTGGLVRHKA